SEMFFDDTGKKRRFNTAILVNQQAEIVGKYRKVHLPGHATYEPEREWQHLEKGYFEVGDLGFPVFRTMGGVMGMCLCNDRRWPETWRVMGMQDVDIVMLGYNTPVYNSIAPESPHLRMFHNHISMQAGAYQNGTWAVGTAKAGMEGGVDMMAGSCIIAPTGEIVALATTSEDEVIVAECDLDKGRYIRDTVFNFAQHRRIENYGVITERTEAIAPPE
ncbi:MAG: N-carbamoyl-D-amino-acid hydrolase, partial [Rhodospirillaceae bacterium]|nr:N-carbamoyl-D-amino-acid hydrolase [Rhodospirillaceae bacterium]